MSEAGLVTRCPNCDTSFHVTEAQLAAAGGAVRCGACLQVFLATEHLVPEGEVRDASHGAGREGEDALVAVDEGEPGDEETSGEVPPDASVPELTLVDDELDREGFDGELNIEPDPAEIVGEYQPIVARHHAAWATGALLLAAVLVAQVAWFNRVELSQRPELRFYYERVCQFLPCDLPTYSDEDVLRITDLVVRSHPSVARALMVDAIIRNDASWRQRFPDIELRFSNIRNKLLAERVFRPAEYLAGEMTGLKYIPARTEVRITLEIVDPGPEATNYSLVVFGRESH